MDMAIHATVIKQHLIDPEICIRCNTCESICPVGAITHDARNYVVDAEKCNWCNDCISPCPTGSIDNYRTMPRVRAYSLTEQLGWDSLPAELSADELAAQRSAEGREFILGHETVAVLVGGTADLEVVDVGARLVEWIPFQRHLLGQKEADDCHDCRERQPPSCRPQPVCRGVDLGLRICFAHSCGSRRKKGGGSKAPLSVTVHCPRSV